MNLLTITGNLTRDPESRTTSDGKTVCNFTVAVNRKSKKPDGTNEADFFRVATWSSLAEACAKHLQKGKKVAVVGSVSVNTYQGQDGTTRASMNVFAQDVEFLSPREKTEGETATETAPVQGMPGAVPVQADDELPF